MIIELTTKESLLLNLAIRLKIADLKECLWRDKDKVYLRSDIDELTNALTKLNKGR